MRGEENLDYDFLEEDEDMGVDGKERRSYANWANHTSNQSMVNAEIRWVGSRLILVLIKALPPSQWGGPHLLWKGIFSSKTQRTAQGQMR